jgi:hypothetical protein
MDVVGWGFGLGWGGGWGQCRPASCSKQKFTPHCKRFVSETISNGFYALPSKLYVLPHSVELNIPNEGCFWRWIRNWVHRVFTNLLQLLFSSSLCCKVTTTTVPITPEFYTAISFECTFFLKTDGLCISSILTLEPLYPFLRKRLWNLWYSRPAKHGGVLFLTTFHYNAAKAEAEFQAPLILTS